MKQIKCWLSSLFGKGCEEQYEAEYHLDGTPVSDIKIARLLVDYGIMELDYEELAEKYNMSIYAVYRVVKRYRTLDANQ